MPSRSQSLPLRQHADPSESDNNIPSGESSPSHEEAADLQMNQTEDTHMSDGTSHARGTATVHPRPPRMPSRSQVPTSVGHDRPQRRNAPDHAQHDAPSTRLPRNGERVRTSRRRDFEDQRPSRIRNRSPGLLSSQEIADLRAVLDNFEDISEWVGISRDGIGSLWNAVGAIEGDIRHLFEITRPTQFEYRSPARDHEDFRHSRGDHRHHPYPGRGRMLTRAVRPARHTNPVRPEPPQASALQLPPSAPPVPSAVPSSDATAGVSPARSTRPGRRAPVPVESYRWVDQGTGFRHSLNVSPAGLPLFPGHVAQAFQAFQGANPSPLELTRRTWLLYRGRKEGNLWKNAVAAAREARHKVILPQSLLLLLELDDLPRNEWEKTTYLWTTSSEPLSCVSPGIRLNPQGFAGLDNHDIDTADLIRMWTSGNPRLISKECGQQRDRHDIKNAFHIALTSLNLWSTGIAVLHAWEPSANLRRLRYVGKLEPAIIAAWLRDEVGLTAHDVSCRFRPFSFRAFDTNATTNPRKLHTELVPPETHPKITDDSLPEFGVDLPWTPAHGPSGPPLKPNDPVDGGQPNASSGAAYAPDTPMEA